MFNYSYKKKIIAGLLIFGAVSALPLYNVFTTSTQTKLVQIHAQPTHEQIESAITEIVNAQSTVSDTLSQELNAEHDRLLIELQKEFPMPEEWKDTLDEIADLKAQDTLLCNNPIVKNNADDHELIKKTRLLLAEYGINPQVVRVFTSDNPKRLSSAAAGQGYDGKNLIHDLEINLPQIAKRSPEAQDAILRHEIMHLLHYDGLEQAAIEAMFARNGITEEAYSRNSVFMDYCRLQEYRADLLSASSSIAIAEAAQKDFEQFMREYPEIAKRESIRHPSLEKRHNAISNLISYMEMEQNTATKMA